MGRSARLLSVLLCLLPLCSPLSSQEYSFIAEEAEEEEEMIALMMSSSEYEELTGILSWQHEEIERLSSELNQAQKGLDVERQSSEWLRKELLKARRDNDLSFGVEMTVGVLSFTVGAVLGVGAGYLIWLWTQ